MFDPNTGVGEPRTIIATTAMWKAMDKIVPLGFFAVEILSNDTIRLKMGNGVNKYSELPFYADEYSLSKIGTWQPNVPYGTNTLVVYNGALMMTLEDLPASTAFDTTKWKPISTEETYNLIQSKLPKVDANRNLLDSISADPGATTVTLNLNSYNIFDKTTGTTPLALPVASSSQAGVMSPNSYKQIEDNTARIQSLEGRISYFLADFTDFNDPSNPSQEELNTTFTTVSGKDKPFDGAVIVNQDDTAVKYRYYSSAELWKIDNTGGVGIASQANLGVVSGSLEDGQVKVHPDGTMSLNGYEALIEGKTYNAAGLSTAHPKTGTIPYVTKASVVEDPDFVEEGGNTPADMLSLDVTSNNVPVELEGLLLNGRRLDFDPKLLSIRTNSEQTEYNLKRGPYTITSPYGTVEMYGHLIAFDEAVKGKGIIRKPDSEIVEATDLGVYAPNSEINLIHIFDKNGNDVCYILSYPNGTDVLIFYPDGTYKTTNLGSTDYNPQTVPEIEILMSADGTRHSLLMTNSHPLGQEVTSYPNFYGLLQLEDCTFQVLTDDTPSLDINDTEGSPDFDHNMYGNCRISWEGHEYYEDMESEAHFAIDTTRATASNLNKRLEYRTGQWQTQSGSVMKYRSPHGIKNGVYHFNVGAQIWWDGTNTSKKILIATPEGFLGWCEFTNNMTDPSNVMWREIPIRNGLYKGKTGILFMSENASTKFFFFVNSYDGKPENTVARLLHTDMTNELIGIGLSNHSQAFNYRPNEIFSDLNRVYFGQNTVNNKSDEITNFGYAMYFNFSDLPGILPKPGVEEGPTNQRLFDFHIIDPLLEIETEYEEGTAPNIRWQPEQWRHMEAMEFANSAKAKGLLVKSGYGNIDMFYPSAPDSFSTDETGRIDGYLLKPYFVERPQGVTGNIGYTENNSRARHWMKCENTHANWHKHHFQCLGTADYINGEDVNVNALLDYYYSRDAGKVVCGAISFNPGKFGLPVVIDDKVMLILGWDGENDCFGLVWKGTDPQFTTPDDFEIYENGDWSPSHGITGGGLIYIDDLPMMAMPASEEPIIKSSNTIAYFFDPETARFDYLGFTYNLDPIYEEVEEPEEGAESVEGEEETETLEPVIIGYEVKPRWAELQMPRQIKVGNIIAYTRKKLILTTEGLDTLASYITVGTGWSVAIEHPDECMFNDVYDITNVKNPDESEDGVYLLTAGEAGFVYVLERDTVSGIPQLTRYLCRDNNPLMIWTLPDGEVNGIPTMRFALGHYINNSKVKNTQRNNPFIIVERIGGTIIENTNPVGFTRVRDFGTDGNEPARLNINAEYAFSEPEFVPYDDKVVQFRNRPIVSYGIFSPFQNQHLIGVNDNGEYVYGYCNFPVAYAGNNMKPSIDGTDIPELTVPVEGVAEIALDKAEDAFISFIDVKPDDLDYAYAYKISDSHYTNPNDRNPETGNFQRYEKICNLWLIGYGDNEAAYNTIDFKYIVTGMPLNSFPQTDGTMFPKEKVALTRQIAGLTGQVTNGGFGPQKMIGQAWDFFFTYRLVGIRGLRKDSTLGTSPNDAPSLCISNHTMRDNNNEPINALNTGVGVPFVQTGNSVPLFDLYTNTLIQKIEKYDNTDILSRIWRRRNNANVNPYSIDTPEGQIPPYLQLSNDGISLVFDSWNGTTWTNSKNFYDQVRTCHPREGSSANQLFMTRDKLEEDDSSIISCFCTDIYLMYKDVVIEDANEIIKRISYLNEKMVAYSMTKGWNINLSPTDFLSVTVDDILPLASSVLCFDIGLDLATMRSDDRYKLYLYVPQSLVIVYKGKIASVINLVDLILRGQTITEYLTVLNTLTVGYAEMSRLVTNLMTVNRAIIADLEATKAKLTNLEVTNAKVTNLEVDNLILKGE